MRCRNITINEMGHLIDEIAKKYGEDHKLDEAAAKTQLRSKLAGCDPQGHGTTVCCCI
jgi:hypothetical protein